MLFGFCLGLFLKEGFKPFETDNNETTEDEKERAKGGETKRIYWGGKSGGTHNDGVERTEHQAEDEIDHSAAVLREGEFDEFDHEDDTSKDAESKNDDSGKRAEIKMQQVFDAGDDWEIEAKNQKQSGAGNTGKNHRGNRDHAGKEDIEDEAKIERGDVGAGTTGNGVEMGNKNNSGNTKK